MNWLCCFAGSSKSHRENSISFIFLESPHQVDMKNVVKSSKHFLGYFNTLENLSAPEVIINRFFSLCVFPSYSFHSVEGKRLEPTKIQFK